MPKKAGQAVKGSGECEKLRENRPSHHFGSGVFVEQNARQGRARRSASLLATGTRSQTEAIVSLTDYCRRYL